VVIYGNDETIVPIEGVHDVPADPMNPGGPLSGTRIGFFYKRFHIFWLSVWTYDGAFVRYQGDRYLPLQPAEIAKIFGKPESQVDRPFWYHFPLGLMIIIGGVILFIVVKVLEARHGPPKSEGGNAASLKDLIPDVPNQPLHHCFDYWYQPGEVLAQRLVSPADFRAFQEKVRRTVAEFAAKQTLGGQAVSLFVAVRPGNQNRFWLQFTPGGVADYLKQDLLRSLQEIPPPAVKDGPVAYASNLLLWGGPGRKDNLFSFMPVEWQHVLEPEGGTIPDDPLSKVWPA
jgi:hypothetical protein